ncbi:MAG: RNA polymerase sigma factor [Thermoanaerobaculia bacterium]|nr:RNA polymerase sigma factor [Thermoanaerobaculia bacterium]
MTESDESLVRAFAGGDADAFLPLYRRHAPLLYGFVTRMVGLPAADDVLQEAWLRAARFLPRFEWRSSLRTWLCGIAANCAREHLRRKGRLDAEVASDGGEIATVWYDAVADQVDLERSIARLSPRYREVLLLHDVLEMTHAEIASALGIDEGTSKSNLSRARAAVRETLANRRRNDE